MYNSGNTIINLSDSKRIDEAKVGNDDGKRGDRRFIRSSPVVRKFSHHRCNDCHSLKRWAKDDYHVVADTCAMQIQMLDKFV